VFFRNNHFSVLHKHNGSLFLLVTDVGYQDTPVVWEKLDQVINFLSFFFNALVVGAHKSCHVLDISD
jgi:hypothetical protein